MALIECDECGNEISDKSQQCPECGNPQVNDPDPSFNDWYDNRLGVVILLIILFPAGVYSLYKNRRYGTATKWIIGVVFGGIGGIFFIAMTLTALGFEPDKNKSNLMEGSKLAEEDKDSSVSSGKLRVTIQDKKANGDSWDSMGGKPDIAICVKTSKEKKCYPSSEHNSSSPSEPQCKNSLTCTFNEVYLEGDTVGVEVIDVDIAADDEVGEAKCEVGFDCEAGLAEVEVVRGGEQEVRKSKNDNKSKEVSKEGKIESDNENGKEPKCTNMLGKKIEGLDPEKQDKRKEAIDKLKAKNIVYEIEPGEKLVRVKVTQKFMSLPYDQKKTFMNVITSWYCLQSESGNFLSVLVNYQTNESIGRFSDQGLTIN